MIFAIGFAAGFSMGVLIFALLAAAKINSLTDDYEERLRRMYQMWRDKP